MKIEELWLILGFLKVCCFALVKTQTNRPPRFLAGGDMARFSLPEDIPVGSTVYKLRGADPDGGAVHYSISGAYFSVNKYSGDVILIKELDRESVDTVEVIISITDEPVLDLESNTASLRREIPIIDVNDNHPTFNSSQYDFTVPENTKIGTVIYSDISISDIDFGLNSMIHILCVQPSVACQIFQVSLDKVSDGHYNGIITLNRALNYEQQSSYTLWLRALDSNPKKPLSSTVKLIIDVEDVQDQPPIFLYTPYSISVAENTKSGEKLLTVEAKDGDIKNLRQIVFSLEQDILHYFTIENNGNGNASIFTSGNPIDREHPTIVQMGGIYSFYVKASEVFDSNSAGDETRELVTVVIEDQNDQLPRFNKPLFRLNISENISAGTPLPNLGMTVYDSDIGENAKFSLSLRASDMRFTDCFSIEPSAVTGKSPVIIRVVDNSGLDYESGIRNIELYASAFTTDENNIPTEVASSEIILTILDANDNAPEFPKSNYIIDVAENVSPGTRIANISAVDRDSGFFSQITYSIGGFGMDKFETDSRLGGLILANKIDYEQQTSYSLTINARDGGNSAATANILVNVIDVNDNPPIFEFNEYRRNIREGSQHFQPKFIVKATDMDGVNNNEITYSIVDWNSDAIQVDEITGEMFMVQPASSQHTSRGQYELKIRATDSGEPKLFTDTMVFIRVGIPGNQRPVFKGTPYNVTIPETSSSNTFITTVRASDPDGPDDLLEYKITAGGDNFHIDSKSGMMYLSENADFNANQVARKQYNVTVLVIDSGVPFRETAQATVTVNVVDVNDKPPVFTEHNYVAYISEETPVGTNVMSTTAKDPDTDALLEYSLVKPFYVTDRRGFTLKGEIGNYSDIFSINKDTGDIKLLHSLRGHLVHRITVFVEVRDKNAVENIEDQFQRVEATFFVEAVEEKGPIFLIGGWMKSSPVIEYDMFEEQSIGSTVMKIIAQDPMTMLPINNFRAKSPLPRQLAMDPVGNIVITESIDYETIPTKTLSFQIEAISEDGETKSDAKVVINVVDINDHSPQFQYKNYQGSVEENSKKGTVVLSVTATDGDLQSSPQGYGNISYHLSGEHAFLFEIDSENGEIKVGNKAFIDREKQPVLNLVATATDTPTGGKERRKSEVSIQIDVLDVNDNAPTFTEKEYSTVILENCPIGVSVLNISATDSDSGSAGQVTYEIANEFDASGLFKIDSKSGEISVQKSLTGRGRNTPYSLTVRAQDNGEVALFTDVQVSIFVGDVVTNDGIPLFIHPTANEMAFISEESPIGSVVFRIVAVDPDDPFTPEGQIQYSILRDGSDADAFHIDAKTGIITSKIKLDREFKKKYSLIIMIKDEGVIPQHATRVLQIHVNDTDDNVPLFKRSVDEKPLQIAMKEELPNGTVISVIEAVDPDEGENAKISYLISDGNEENYFSIVDSANNTALIQVARRVDREQISQILLTIKCFKKQNKPKMPIEKSYNKTDLSERQVQIKILDVDDNQPEFLKENVTIAVHFNAQIDSLLLTLKAHDKDAEAGPIVYNIRNAVYSSPRLGLEFGNTTLPFSLNENTGELCTNSSMIKYVDGYFLLEVSASSGLSTIASLNYVKIYIIRERNLVSFVFSQTPADVKDFLINFKSELESVLALPSAQFNLYETQFHSKPGGNLDFSKTSSCFQIIADNFGSKEAESFFKDKNNDRLKEVYRKYNVQSIERCGNLPIKLGMTWVQVSLLAIATFIGVVSLISSCILCCSYSRWQRLK